MLLLFDGASHSAQDNAQDRQQCTTVTDEREGFIAHQEDSLPHESGRSLRSLPSTAAILSAEYPPTETEKEKRNDTPIQESTHLRPRGFRGAFPMSCLLLSYCPTLTEDLENVYSEAHIGLY